MRNLLAILIGVTVIASCATQISLPYRDKVNFIGTNRYIDVENIVTGTDNGYLTVQALLTNDGASAQQLYYRCIYFDDKGMLVEDNSQWTPVQIFGGGKQYIRCMSRVKNLLDYKIELSTTGDAMQVYK